MFYSVFLIFLHFLNVQSFSLSKFEPQEIQHATCNIITKEIEATAKATITKRLEGVCSSEELKQFQGHFLQKIEEIKDILKENGFKIPQNNATNDDIKFLEDYDYNNVPSVAFKSLSTKTEEANTLSIDIAMFNDTIVESQDGEVYYYYWNIENIQKLLEKNNIYISSPKFSALGHTLYIHFFPNLEEHIGLQLKPESAGFIKKHRFTIINQKNPSREVSSKILTGLNNNMFKIYLPMILGDDFIANSTLLIKLKLFLNS